MGYSISIVIPAHNAGTVLGRCLEACLAQEYEEEIEVIVVDDGSTDQTAEVAARYLVCYIRQENSGPAMARNAGAQASKGDLIFFTDSDCAPEKLWAAKLAPEFDDPSVGAAGGSYDIGNPGCLLARCVHEEIIQRHRRMSQSVNYLGGFNVCYRREAFEQAGGFDDGFRMASAEDNDLSYRVHKNGWGLRFNFQARVSHLHPCHLGRYLRSQFWHGYWSMRLYRRHPDMTRGDAYINTLEPIEQALFTLALIAMPLMLWSPARVGVSIFLGVLALLQLRRPVQIVMRVGDMRFLALAPVTFVRGLVRAAGMIFGLWRFWLWNPWMGQNLLEITGEKHASN